MLRKVALTVIPIAAILPIILLILGSALLPTGNIKHTSFIGLSSIDSKFYGNVTVAIIGGDDALRKYVHYILDKLGVRKVLIYDKVTEQLKGIDIVILLSKASEQDVLRLLKSNVVLIAPDKIYRESILPVLKSIAMIVVTYNGTNVYAVKLLNKLPNGKYAVAIHGSAGKLDKNILARVLKWCLKARKLTVKKISTAKVVFLERAPVSIKASSNPPGVKVTNIKLEVLNSQPYWVTIGYVSWSSEDEWRPYGRLNIEHEILWLANDPDPNMDWFIVKCVTQAIPGTQIYKSDWHLEDIYNEYYLKEYTDIYELRDYEPTSRVNPVTVSVTLGKDVSATISWTYPADYIDRIVDRSDFSTDIAGWWHDIHYADVTIKIEPGFEFTVSPPQTGTQMWVIAATWGKWNILYEDFMTTVAVFHVQINYG